MAETRQAPKALSREKLNKIVKLLRKAGINVGRNDVYPPDPKRLQGLYRIFECPKCKGPMIFRWEKTVASEIPELYIECLSCGLRIFSPKTDMPPLKDKVIACFKLPEIPARVSLDETG